MINVNVNYKKTIIKFFCLLVGVILLQACGGQRDEPFNPGSPDSNRGAKISMEKLLSDDETFMNVPAEGRRIEIRDDDTLDEYWGEYTNTPHETIDFVKGQVLLLDLGEKRGCDRKLTLKTFAAYEVSVNSAVVVLDYDDPDTSSSSASTSSVSSSSSSSSSSSVCSDVTTTQSYYFFYIESRKTLTFEDNVN